MLGHGLGLALIHLQGWDWGPAVNTSGPWKPVYLDIFENRIDELLIRQEVSADLKTAVLSVKGSTEHLSPNQEVSLELLDPAGSRLQNHILEVAGARFETSITIKSPQLWYPHTYGDQPLYTVTARIPGKDSRSQSIGLRRLKLLQHPLQNAEGKSFVFEINNIRTFAGGSCWIPGDFMLPRMTRQRYSDWLKLAKSGNQNMIRVWGGGIVETDDFYDICDREGILVWQDFLFACGNYPASQDFMENVKLEAEAQLRRVGHHVSLVLWAGNNEDYLLAEKWGWELDMTDEKGPWDQTDFPAREIYERLLPRVVEELGGDVPYWRSSPYGGSFSNDTTVGDTHIWDGEFSQLFCYWRQMENAKANLSNFKSGMVNCHPTKSTRTTLLASSANSDLNRVPPCALCTVALQFPQKGTPSPELLTFMTKDPGTHAVILCIWARTSVSA